jgi:ABC-type nitrate/sulfonate/bicarbonate transport system substrate-binding protein
MLQNHWSPERRWSSITAALLVGLLLTACGGSSTGNPAASNAPVEVNVGWQPGSTFSALPYLVADTKGFFKEQGLNVHVQQWNGSTGSLVSATLAGSEDVALISLATAADQYSQGAGLRFMGPLVRTLRFWVTRPDDNIPDATAVGWEATLKAMKGRVVGTAGLGTGPQLEFTGLMKQVGVDQNSISFINVANGAPQLAALKSKTVDVVFTSQANADQLVALGYKVVFNSAKNAPTAYKNALFIGSGVTTKFLNSNPSFAGRWRAASDKMFKFVTDTKNTDELIKIILAANNPDSPTLRPDFVIAQTDGTYVNPLKADQIDSGIKWLLDVGILKKVVAAKDLMVKESLN